MNHENKYPNLIPNCERSPEELREMGRKGGIKSGESRRRKREQKKHIRMLVKILAERPEVKKAIKGLSEYFDVQQHNNGLSFDLTLKNESKAKGIKELAKALNVPVEDTIAFGDGRNDVEMLSEVGLGIAMGNAAKEAKDVAKFITKDIGDHGIVYAIEYFSLLR